MRRDVYDRVTVVSKKRYVIGVKVNKSNITRTRSYIFGDLLTTPDKVKLEVKFNTDFKYLGYVCPYELLEFTP